MVFLQLGEQKRLAAMPQASVMAPIGTGFKSAANATRSSNTKHPPR
jgi:hypothetical protein